MRAKSTVSRWQKVFAGVVAMVVVAVGCRQIAGLDGIEYEDDFCNFPVDCDDGNACTEELCSADAVCSHTTLADGQYPDGKSGNCTAILCNKGLATEVLAVADIDDGNECTLDACNALGGTHEVDEGASCHLGSALGKCDAGGKCVVSCGKIGPNGEDVACPPATGECQISYCDEASSTCVEEQLDGVALPGTTPDSCGGSYCVAGQKVEELAATGEGCFLPDGEDGKCNGQGACVECIVHDDCKDDIGMSACHQWMCNAGKCDYNTEPNGALATQTPGDCKTHVCQDGKLGDYENNQDIPDDGNDCTDDWCNDKNPMHADKNIGTACGMAMNMYCDGNGTCKGCLTDSHCADSNECTTTSCMMPEGTCLVVKLMVGTPTKTQTNDDCALMVCDGMGGMMQVLDEADPNHDGNDCTTETCMGIGMTIKVSTPAGAICNDNNGEVCDGNAHCVGGNCSFFPPDQCPNGTECVDGVCCDQQCDALCMACSSGKKGSGPDGLCGPVSGDPDGDCAGNSSCNAGACQAVATGMPCQGGAGECASGFCVDGVCCNTACNTTCQSCNQVGSVGTCTPVPFGTDQNGECQNGDCNGMGACKLSNGRSCMTGADCLNGNCVDGVCCNTVCNGTCQACSNAKTGQANGTCVNVPVASDPDNECANGSCNGIGQCKLDIAQTCVMNGDCLSGFCVDGVCCNNSCTNTCKACSVAGSAGTCVNVPNNTDPAMECPGAAFCNGNGACQGGGPGAACGSGVECQSGNCVDNVCCNSACVGPCRACNLMGLPGICAPAPAGTDPENECNDPTPNCDGAGTCGP